MIGIRLGTLFFFFMLAASPSFSSVARRDFFVESDHGIRLFVREVSQSVTPSPKGARSQPILLIHGARVPGLASFDLPVAGGSLAEDFAERGFDVFIVDLRGYGKSTRPSGMDEPPSAHSPLVRSNEAVRDIAAVVDWIRDNRRVPKVALFGWATGGQWAGYYASPTARQSGRVDCAQQSLPWRFSASFDRPRVRHGRSRSARSFQSKGVRRISPQRCRFPSRRLGPQHP